MEYSDLLTNYFFTSIENLLNISVSDLLWPLPHSINSTNYPLELIKFDKIELDDCSLSDETCKTLLNSLKITINSLRSKCNYDVTNSSALLFKIKFKIDFDDILNPQQLLHVDESYVLTVSPKLMEIQAKTRIGFIYAMQTLSQLVISTKKNCYIAAAQIIDKPRFSHRGFMLDSSRNFFSVNDIKRQLDAMFYTKLNVLHWHIYDAQSFPIKWEYDGGRLYKNSAYKWDDGSLKVYSKNDVKDIIDYAFQLGIRIIPEFDMPGHTTVFSKAYPEIMKCADFGPGFDGQKGINWVKRRCNQPPCGQLNPDAEKTYVIIEQFLKDMGEWFPDHYQHLGFDEVNPMCWGFPSNDLNHVTDKIVKFGKLVLEIQKKNNKIFLGWDEVIQSYNFSASAEIFGNSVINTDNAIVQVWSSSAASGNIDPISIGVDPTTNSNSMIEVSTKLGYKTIASPSDFWYLDCGPQVPWCADKFDNNKPVWHSWKKMYDFNPTKSITNKEKVIGGEAALWSEAIKENSLDYVIWPRLAAVAERLWSKEEVILNERTEARLNRFRSSLINEIYINASITSNFEGKLDNYYRVEWCDFNLNSDSQKAIDSGYPGIVKNDSKEYYDYCETAKNYKTNSLKYSVPNRVEYPF